MRKLRTGSRQRISGDRAAKRSGREWAVRGILALTAMIVGYASVTSALANVIVGADARTAHMLAPDDGRITAALAGSNFSASPASERDSQQALLARRALLQDPTAVDALAVLGLQAQLRAEGPVADRLFDYSVALSRRELRAQIWAIENAVSRGDIARALRNYDLAIRTSSRARQTLFPVLASAIAEPGIRTPLIETLAAAPPWAATFIHYVPGSSLDPREAVKFFREGIAMGLPIEDTERARVVTGLVRRGLMEEAWNYYASFRPGVRKDRSRDPDFALNSEATAPFDWNVGNDQGLSAAILLGADGGFVDFAAPASTRATVVRQTQLLPPGRYRIEGQSSGIDQPERSRPYWALSCQDGPELGRVDIPNSDQGNSVFSGVFVVPPRCPVQILSLVIRGSDRISGVAGQIRHLQLAPAND